MKSELRRWDTPLSDQPLISLESISLEDNPRLLLRTLSPTPPYRRFAGNLPKLLAFRSVLEPFFTEGEWLTKAHFRFGPTLEVVNSEWIEERIALTNGALDAVAPKLRHYVIVTEQWVLELIASKSPEFLELPSVEEIRSEGGILKF